MCGLGGTLFYSLLITKTGKYKVFYTLCSFLVNIGTFHLILLGLIASILTLQ